MRMHNMNRADLHLFLKWLGHMKSNKTLARIYNTLNFKHIRNSSVLTVDIEAYGPRSGQSMPNVLWILSEAQMLCHFAGCC